jgi:hypothetical protein
VKRNLWLGATSPGRLALPAAEPTPSQLYAPRGVFLNDEVLIAADSGNHRILIWNSLPQSDAQPADVVLCQPTFFTEGPNAAGRGPENGFHLPTGVGVFEGKLCVADAWHHRILVWNEIPRVSDTPPDFVIGQENFTACEPNRGAAINAHSFYWPYGIGFFNGWFYVTDTGNRRVMGWRGFPAPNQPADLILGQATPHDGEENRGVAANARSFRWPHAIAGNANILYVADAGNHRVLGWRGALTEDRDADVVIGQQDFSANAEFPYVKQGAAKFRFPYCIACEENTLAVADTANNRVLLWKELPLAGCGGAADAVIGQPDFDATGENHWKAVTHDSVCWPYGICLHQDKLAVADSGNNRVMLWELDGTVPPWKAQCISVGVAC